MTIKIDNYKFGRITINGNTYTNDLIIFPDRIKDNWRREEGHLLRVEDLNEVWEENPKKLIVGKGAKGIMGIDKKIINKCNKEGIELIAKKSKEACRYYNSLENEEKEKSILAIHLTC